VGVSTCPCRLVRAISIIGVAAHFRTWVLQGFLISRTFAADVDDSDVGKRHAEQNEIPLTTSVRHQRIMAHPHRKRGKNSSGWGFYVVMVMRPGSRHLNIGALGLLSDMPDKTGCDEPSSGRPPTSVPPSTPITPEMKKIREIEHRTRPVLIKKSRGDLDH